MRELYITYADHRIKYGKDAPVAPSRFLEEIPDGVIKRLDRYEESDPEQEEKEAKEFFANIKTMLGD